MIQGFSNPTDTLIYQLRAWGQEPCIPHSDPLGRGFWWFVRILEQGGDFGRRVGRGGVESGREAVMESQPIGYAACPECRGTRQKSDGSPCPGCKGTGLVAVYRAPAERPVGEE